MLRVSGAETTKPSKQMSDQTKANQANVKAEATAINQQVNEMITPTGTHAIVMGHYIGKDLEGMAALVFEILSERNAIFPQGVGATALRNVALAAGMLSEEIVEEVKLRFTAKTGRHPRQSVKSFLSSYFRTECKWIQSIQMTGKEDTTRTCCRPRCKYCIVEGAPITQWGGKVEQPKPATE